MYFYSKDYALRLEYEIQPLIAKKNVFFEIRWLYSKCFFFFKISKQKISVFVNCRYFT